MFFVACTLKESSHLSILLLMERIRLAKKSEIEDVYALFLRVKKEMERNHNFTWSGGYPDKDIFVEDIHNRSLLVFLKDDAIIGSAATNEDAASYFFPSSFDERKAKELLSLAHCDNGFPTFILERFMIDPNEQKRGEGSRFLSFIMRKEKQKNCLLSVYKENGNAVRFYQKNGYFPYGDCKGAEWGIDGSSCWLFAKPYIKETKQ